MRNERFADLHLGRQACIYVRQSTMAQVRFNQESTERRYNLANQARSLDWISEQIRILDQDLAQSGELTTKRDDFKTLVSDGAIGHVGAIFSLGASPNKDWHRLLERWSCVLSPRHWCPTETPATIYPTSTTALSSV